MVFEPRGLGGDHGIGVRVRQSHAGRLPGLGAVGSGPGGVDAEERGEFGARAIQVYGVRGGAGGASRGGVADAASDMVDGYGVGAAAVRLAPKRIVLELTERLEVSEYGPLLAVLAPLRAQGLRIAVDDAGSGFASLRHVLNVRPDIIKLDRSLIAGIDDDRGQHALGAAIGEFARQIGASLVAEGIETPEEFAAVAALGHDSRAGLPHRPAIDRTPGMGLLVRASASRAREGIAPPAAPGGQDPPLPHISTPACAPPSPNN